MIDNTDIQLFNLKNELIRGDTYLNVPHEINLYSFFDLVFCREGGKGSDEKAFEDRLCPEYCSWAEGKPYEDQQPFVYNALLCGIKGKRGEHHVVINDDYSYHRFVERHPFCITSPISYIGKTRKAQNARYLFALTFDLDGVGLDQIHDLNHQIGINFLPQPSIVVNSGHGLHLYYLLKKPIALFQDAVTLLQKLKHALTDVIWNLYTSDHKTKQFQGIYQGFRVPGSKTKLGTTVTAFTSDKAPKYWTCSELNKYIRDPEERLSPAELNRLDKGIFDPKRLTKKRAKELYPEWYERVIVRGDKTRHYWTANRGLYDWWLKKLRHKDTRVTTGHRYFCLLALACFGVKCQIPKDEVERDLFSFVDEFDAITDKEDNHFTVKDAEDAFKAYKADYCTFPRHVIERLTNIRIDQCRRNGRKRKDHLKGARALQAVYNPNWRNKDGRPKGSTISAENSIKAKKIAEWRESNPEGNKSACARSLGFSRPTVHKWWNG